MKTQVLKRRAVDTAYEESEEEEIAAHLGGGEPRVGHFTMGFNTTGSKEEDN